MEEDLRSFLLGGHAIPQNIHYVVRPQGSAIPVIILTRISFVPFYTMDGADGLAMSRVQADVYASTWTEAKAVTRALAERVSGYRGIVGSTVFQLIEIDGERDYFDAGSNDADRFFRVSSDLMIHHRST
jgi:hypothetical protein